MKLALLGDIALFGVYDLKQNKQLLNNLAEISDYLKGFDCVVGNLETPFSRKKKSHGAKSAYICADVENAKILKLLNLSAVCLANNHLFDYGEEGCKCTIDTLNSVGIPYFGIDGKEFLLEYDGNKLIFTGFCCYSSNPLQAESEYGKHGVNCYNVRTVGDIVKKYHSAGYLNVVAVHAGVEHVNYPHTDHVRAARLIADIAPYIYYGHHPHVIQGVEEYKGGLLAHSLGNFCFDDVYSSSREKPLVELTNNNRTGLILELEVKDSKLVGWKETITHIGDDGKIAILSEVPDCIDEYNTRLRDSLATPDYSQCRQIIIDDRLAERKAQRNLRWYLQRLRPRYAQIMFNARVNAKSYSQNVKRYIR